LNLKLENKTALVTGSTAGIGFAIARSLAAEGTRVIVNGRTEERVSEAIAAILRSRPNAMLEPFVADLADAEATIEAARRFPSIDILVNNLGVYEPKPFEQVTDDDWRAIIQTNFMSGVRLSRHLFAADEIGKLGSHHFHFERVRHEHSGRDDSLRSHKDDAGGACARIGRDDSGYSRYGQFGACRPNSFGRR